MYVLLPDYAAHEAVYLSQAIASDEFALKENPKYVNKTVAPTLEPVKSIGGFRTLPDYSFETMPDDYAALVLIGGFGCADCAASHRERQDCRRHLQRGLVLGKTRIPQCRPTYRQRPGTTETLGWRQLHLS